MTKHYDPREPERRIREFCCGVGPASLKRCSEIRENVCAKEHDEVEIQCVERCQRNLLACMKDETRVPGDPCWEERLRGDLKVPRLSSLAVTNEVP